MNRPLPLLANADLDAAIAWVDGEAVSAGRFLAETLALAERLPAEGEVVNFCNDRYLFALGFAAALCSGLGSLFPPNARPETLSLLADAAVARTVLVDVADIDTGGLPKLLITRPSPTALAHERPLIDGDLVAACLLTSGSTGVPQPHAKRWQTLVLNIAAEAERLAAMLGRSDLIGLTLVATVPPQHSYGFESSVLLALLGGATFDSGRPFYPADIAAALARVPRPRALVTTPFHLKTLLQSGVAVPPVDLILSATAPLSPQLAAEAERVMGGALIEIYGCTEAGQVASRRTTAGDVWQTLGELRVYRAVADAGDGQDIPAAAQAPEATEVFMVDGGHVAEPTPLADLLEIHDERHFRLLGRANDLIHVAGRRSSLAHLNFHLNRIEGIEDGCFWLPDEDGEVVARTVAFVVSRTLSARQVVAALRPHVDGIFLPRRVVFVDALPREATGKLTAQTLRHFAAVQLKSAEPAVDAAEAAAPTAEVRVPCRIEATHPAFDGHFPGQPVLPGVVLLSEVLAAALATPAIADRLGPCPVFDSAKFLAPVGPGCDLVVVLIKRTGSQPAWQFEVQQGERVMARGVLRAGAPTGAPS